jgi:hypothetical protein
MTTPAPSPEESGPSGLPVERSGTERPIGKGRTCLRYAFGVLAALSIAMLLLPVLRPVVSDSAVPWANYGWYTWLKTVRSFPVHIIGLLVPQVFYAGEGVVTARREVVTGLWLIVSLGMTCLACFGFRKRAATAIARDVRTADET